jgi:hypothetical protein
MQAILDQAGLAGWLEPPETPEHSSHDADQLSRICHCTTVQLSV